MLTDSSTPGDGLSTRASFLRGSCTWDFPKAAHTLELRLRVVEWLNETLIEGMYARVRGVEVGGFLLGRTELGRRRRTIIEGFTPILCRRASGYVSDMSAEEKCELKQHLARWAHGPGKNLYVVGCYRSHNGEGFRLDQADLSLANEYFLGPRQVFLLIKPDESETGIAAFLHQTNASHDSSLQAFLVNSHVLAGGVKKIRRSSNGAFPAVTPSPMAARVPRADLFPTGGGEITVTSAGRHPESTDSRSCPRHILTVLLHIPVPGKNVPDPKPDIEYLLPYIGVKSISKTGAQPATIGEKYFRLLNVFAGRIWRKIRKPPKPVAWYSRQI